MFNTARKPEVPSPAAFQASPESTRRRGGNLQGRLVFAFVALLVTTLGASCWLFVRENTKRLAIVLGEQARQTSMTLAYSLNDELATNDVASLRRTCSDLIKSRNLLFVTFVNVDGKPIAMASRDIDLKIEDLSASAPTTRDLTQVTRRTSPTLGTYLEVTAPVFTSVVPASGGREASSEQLLGYVSVGVSPTHEESQLNRINLLIIGIGCLSTVCAIPLAYVLIHRSFLPIRKLLNATRQIIRGDLDTRVDVERSDVIGDLARSFNEMVRWVRSQQEEVIVANTRLFEANRDLEQRINQRTLQLETANARLSGEIAEKEDFLRAVSHDLNAPLRNIAGMATMLLMKYRGKLDEDVCHRLERIKKNVEVETDLIGELLELSRIKTRRQKMENVDMEAMVWELRGMFENDLRTRAIDLIVDSALPVLNCERPRVRQVLQNLVDNAIKYMGEGHVRQIHIGCTVRVTEAEFYVRDTGMGIAPEDIDKVFFIFRRGKNVADKNIAGKGIGLASVKSIVETYAGRIWVESKLGEGTAFRFTINGRHVPETGRCTPAQNKAMAASAANELPDPEPTDVESEDAVRTA